MTKKLCVTQSLTWPQNQKKQQERKWELSASKQALCWASSWPFPDMWPQTHLGNSKKPIKPFAIIMTFPCALLISSSRIIIFYFFCYFRIHQRVFLAVKKKLLICFGKEKRKTKSKWIIISIIYEKGKKKNKKLGFVQVLFFWGVDNKSADMHLLVCMLSNRPFISQASRCEH